MPKGCNKSIIKKIRLLFKLLFGAHHRKINDVADGEGVGEKHRKAVDADPKASGRGHSLTDCFNKLFIHGICLVIASLAEIILIF